MRFIRAYGSAGAVGEKSCVRGQTSDAGNLKTHIVRGELGSTARSEFAESYIASRTSRR